MQIDVCPSHSFIKSSEFRVCVGEGTGREDWRKVLRAIGKRRRVKAPLPKSLPSHGQSVPAA